MITLFHYKLNQNELYSLTTIMEYTHYPYWQIVDISKNDNNLPISLDDGRFSDSVIFVYDKTKAKSAFEKRIDTAFGIKDVIERFYNSIRIDRPNTYASKADGLNEVWEKIKPLCVLRKQTITKEDLPSLIAKNLGKILEVTNGGSSFKFSDDYGKTMEIRPNNSPASMTPSMTYEELLILVSFRYVMDFSKLEIIN